MVLIDLADSFCHSQKNAGLKGLINYLVHLPFWAYITSDRTARKDDAYRRSVREFCSELLVCDQWPGGQLSCATMLPNRTFHSHRHRYIDAVNHRARSAAGRSTDLYTRHIASVIAVRLWRDVMTAFFAIFGKTVWDGFLRKL